MGQDKIVNGIVSSDFVVTQEQIDTAFQQLNEVHTMVTNYSGQAQHLSQLPIIASGITAMNTKLLDSAIGTTRIPVDIYKLNMRIFGFVIGALVFVIVFLLTGVKFGWIGPLH